MAKVIKQVGNMSAELKSGAVLTNIEIESEYDFLKRLQNFQHNGGWGKHLDPMINERLKLIGEPPVEESIPEEWLK